MTETYIIYGLVDPRSGELRYVGKSVHGLRRAREHAQPSSLRKNANPHKCNWLRQLLTAGLKPDIEVLETHETAEALVEAEKHFIAYFRSIGCRLLNSADGGEGSAGWRHDPATIEEFRRARRGPGNSMFGRPSAMAGRSHTPEALLKMAHQPHAKRLVDNHGVSYPSIAAAARSLGKDPADVSRLAKKGRVLRYAA